MAHRARARTPRGQTRDRYVLYEKSVQAPEVDIALVQRTFRHHYGRPARTLREDFCGTAALACQWVENHAENHALGVDIDPEPLAWCRAHHAAALSPAQAERLWLVEGDVRTVRAPRVDVTVAFNFSFFVFRTRDELRSYFAKARRTLAREGLFFLDAYGGADAFRTMRERRRVDGFFYVWDQHAVDPISHAVTNFIHFHFRGGGRMLRAFRYDWRLWTIPELRELLAEAGFSHSEVYWEGTDHSTGEGNGIFTRRERAPDDPAWVCYIAATP
jgi:hypothetical protein